MKDTINVVAFVCDGCHKRKIVEQPEYAYGYHGTVAHIHEHGGSAPVEFYACSTRCIGKAVQNAIEASENENTDPELTAEDLREEQADKAQARGLSEDELEPAQA